MRGADPVHWPKEFSAVEADPPEGWAVLGTVLDPMLLIRRGPQGLQAELVAHLHRRAGSLTLTAPSLSCTWVCGGGFICPLPRDVSGYLDRMLQGMNPQELTLPQALALYRSSGEEIGVELDSDVLVSANDAADVSGSVEIPGLKATLFPYQSKGVAWMRSALDRTGGVVLADEMGLGKTLQIIALLLLDRPSHQNPALILCPTTLIANWVRELERFAPELRCIVHRGSERARLPRHLQQSELVITTYDTLVNDSVIFEALQWSWVVCDEAQALKNPDSQRRCAVASLRRSRAVPVTGTPVENHLLDLWSLVDLAIPGLLGDRTTFVNRFPDSEAAAREVARLTNPIVLKRRVREVAKDLPPRTDILVPLELDAELAERYEAVRTKALEMFPKAGAMVATGQLQLFCADPSLTMPDCAANDWDDVVAHEPYASGRQTPKLERTVALIREAFSNGRKVLLFANFNACGQLIREAAHWPTSTYWSAINGSTAAHQRQEIVDAFALHAGPAILILNPRAAGAGLNITAATVVIHYTQVWNPALELQASARAYRRGQNEPVTIYHMYYVDTIEEVMMERAQRRREMGNEAVPTTAQDQADINRALQISPRVIS